jgi:hypothetical protein
VTRKRHDGTTNPELLDLADAARRIKAAVGCDEVGRGTEDVDVPFDGGHQKLRVVIRVDHLNVGDDATCGFR